jgi:hypothetical protein
VGYNEERMSSENIFSALAKDKHPKDENYLTESFVFVINSLLQKDKDKDIGLELLNKLCARKDEFSFDEDESISVSTQVRTDQGTPDIKVSSPDKLIYIEVKHDSPLGYKQIERYKEALESSPAIIKHVNLLTRFTVDFKDGEQPYKHIRWYEVYNWLAKAQARVKDPVCSYLIDSFNSFLEGKQMIFQRVGWEYINGVPALINLINMIEAGIQSAKIPIHGKSPGWDFKGFWLDKKRFLCGVYTISEPLVITFELMNQKGYNKNLAGEPVYPMREDKDCIWFRLELDKIHFFSLGKEEQIEEITKFVKTAYGEARKMRIADK